MIASEKNKAAYKKVNTILVDIKMEDREDGSKLLYAVVPLEPHPYRLTERLQHWAAVTPDNIFIGRRNEAGSWDTLTYAETFTKVKSIAQALLNRKISTITPVAILSENSVEHALIALAALHTGIPHSPVAPAYSLRSVDFDKLKHVIGLLTPGLIFVQDAKKYEKALKAVANNVEVVSLIKPDEDSPVEIDCFPCFPKNFQPLQPRRPAFSWPQSHWRIEDPHAPRFPHPRGAAPDQQ